MLTFEDLPVELCQYINEWKHEKGNLLMILRKIQDHYHYVPKNISFILAKELKIPLARIYEVLTFYHYFKLEESAKYKIQACSGTACYLKGSSNITEVIQEKLKTDETNKSQDGLFKLETVRCMGCCGLSPVISINNKVYGKLNEKKVVQILDYYIEKG